MFIFILILLPSLLFSLPGELKAEISVATTLAATQVIYPDGTFSNKAQFYFKLSKQGAKPRYYLQLYKINRESKLSAADNQAQLTISINNGIQINLGPIAPTTLSYNLEPDHVVEQFIYDIDENLLKAMFNSKNMQLTVSDYYGSYTANFNAVHCRSIIKQFIEQNQL